MHKFNVGFGDDDWGTYDENDGFIVDEEDRGLLKIEEDWFL